MSEPPMLFWEFLGYFVFSALAARFFLWLLRKRFRTPSTSPSPPAQERSQASSSPSVGATNLPHGRPIVRMSSVLPER